MVCGPTASGKSRIADHLADLVSEEHKSRTPVVVVDSMQVYKEIPRITNQERRRPAELLGVVSVAEEWSMAHHRRTSDDILGRTEEGPFVLDAGTGMYLNALLLDIPIYGKVAPEVRAKAESLSRGASNPRRASRQRELELAGESRRGSIWTGDLRYDLSLLYLRPDRSRLDARISRRSSEIAQSGIEEASRLLEMCSMGATPKPSVRDSIGVREMVSYVRGDTSLREAEESIRTRTRRLARRQIRWFDKLANVLDGRANTIIVSDPTQDLSTLFEVVEI